MGRELRSFENKNFGQLRKAVKDVLERFENVDSSSLAKSEKELLNNAIIRTKGFFNELENEIQAEAFEIMNEMLFKDITTQQIHQANNLIEAAERKLMDFRQILALVSGKKPKAKQSRAGTGLFNPGATLDKREELQSLADEITTRYEKKK